MNKTSLLSIADGLVCSLCYVLFSEYFFSVYAQRIDAIETLMGICTVILAAFMILCAVLLAMGLHRLQNRWAMVRYSLVSLLVRILCMGLGFVNLLTFRIRLFPLGDFWYGETFIYLFMIVAYLICSGILRLGVLAVYLIRCQAER